MQLDLFGETDVLHDRIKFVASQIIYSDSIRTKIKQAIKENDRNELIKLFDKSIRTYGFGGYDRHKTTWSWSRGTLKGSNGEEHKITARQLTDISLALWGGYDHAQMDDGAYA